MEKNTFKNLMVLKTVQKEVKEKLGSDYNGTITHFVTIISKVMDSNQINEFEALKKIKDNLSFYKSPGAPECFSAAVIEITEAKNFSYLKE